MEFPSFSRWNQLSLFLSSLIPHPLDALNFQFEHQSSGCTAFQISWYIWVNEVSLCDTKLTTHWRIQSPHNRINRTTITMVNRVFHQSPFTHDRIEVQKGRLSSDIAFTWPFMSSRVADILPDKSGIYTPHSTLIIAQVPPCAETMVSLKIIPASPCSSSWL